MDNNEDLTFQELWKEITNQDGSVNVDKVKEVLDGYAFMLDEVPKVYCEVTHGMLSKPHYYAESVLSIFRERFEDKVWALRLLPDDWDDVTADCKTNEDYKRAIFEYLEIEED